MGPSSSLRAFHAQTEDQPEHPGRGGDDGDRDGKPEGDGSADSEQLPENVAGVMERLQHAKRRLQRHL